MRISQALHPEDVWCHGPAQAVDAGIYPIEAKNGIKVMSVNLLLPREDEPVDLERTDSGKYGKTVLDRC